eukprot:753997-Hanusia_phi.AAC.2
MPYPPPLPTHSIYLLLHHFTTPTCLQSVYPTSNLVPPAGPATPTPTPRTGYLNRSPDYNLDPGTHPREDPSWRGRRVVNPKGVLD